MPYSAIIAEYDPFHSGHAYHIKATKDARADGVAVIMSGNYTQRGLPAIMPREYRACAAVQSGADIVFELPAPWSCACAEVFAKGAVGLINALGIFDTLSFGSFSHSTAELSELAEITASDEFSEHVLKCLDGGVSYPRALALALEEKQEWAKLGYLLHDPNAVLACEYIKVLNKLHSKVKPLNIMRIGVGHGEELPSSGFASASLLRNRIRELYNKNMELYNLSTLKTYFTDSGFSMLLEACKSGACPLDMRKFDVSALTVLRTKNRIELETAFEAAEGLENRIYKAVKKSGGFIEAADLAKTKRFTHSRIRRTMLSAYLGADSQLYSQSVPYARVMAMNDRGCEMLKEAQKISQVPIITRIPKSEQLGELANIVFEFNSRAEDLYNLSLPIVRKSETYYSTKLIKY